MRTVTSSKSMVTCASPLLHNPAKVPYFQYRAWWCSIVQKFRNEGKKNQDSQFWAYFGLRPWSCLSPRISKLGMMVCYGLEISYWWLKIIFYFFSCPVIDQQPKNVLPISLVTRNFLFIVGCPSSDKFFCAYLCGELLALNFFRQILNFLIVVMLISWCDSIVCELFLVIITLDFHSIIQCYAFS
jgi:hypothetical protein